jgi:hypothetical protein
MARPRKYRSNAEKQAAYRQRKQAENGNNRNNGNECNHLYEPGRYEVIPPGLTYAQVIEHLKQQLRVVTFSAEWWDEWKLRNEADRRNHEESMRNLEEFKRSLEELDAARAKFDRFSSGEHWKHQELIDLLKSDPGALKDVKRALWKRYHPDLAEGNPHANEEKMKIVNRAVDQLNGKR